MGKKAIVLYLINCEVYDFSHNSIILTCYVRQVLICSGLFNTNRCGFTSKDHINLIANICSTICNLKNDKNPQQINKYYRKLARVRTFIKIPEFEHAQCSQCNHSQSPKQPLWFRKGRSTKRVKIYYEQPFSLNCALQLLISL